VRATFCDLGFFSLPQRAILYPHCCVWQGRAHNPVHGREGRETLRALPQHGHHRFPTASPLREDSQAAHPSADHHSPPIPRDVGKAEASGRRGEISTLVSPKGKRGVLIPVREIVTCTESCLIRHTRSAVHSSVYPISDALHEQLSVE
jgi:hypothetical protein